VGLKVCDLTSPRTLPALRRQWTRGVTVV
jgi:hypothetical protein